MLNLVAVQLRNYLLSGPMIDRSESFAVVGRIPQTRLLSPNSWLPILIPGTHFHLGVVIAVLAAIGAWVLLRRTGFILVMYEGRIVGEVDPRTASRETIGLLMAGTPAHESSDAGR